MSYQELPANPSPTESNEFLVELLAPLGTISTRMDLLQRVTKVTPGLNDLERTVLLEGLAATQNAAQRLAKLLESMISEAARSDGSPLPFGVSESTAEARA
jgi:hypothetical protein